MTTTNIILAITAITTALIAGVFYIWSCAVIPGLAKVPDETYIRTMQAINIAIQNPIFFASFMGTLFLLPLSTYLNYTSFNSPRFLCLLAASIIYAVGVFGVTAFGNVPMNDKLDAFKLDGASTQDIHNQRVQYEKPWNRLNTVRTVANFISLVLVISACLSKSNIVDNT